MRAGSTGRTCSARRRWRWRNARTHWTSRRIAIVGSTGRDYHVVFDHGLDAVIGTVNRPMQLDRAVAEAPRLIAEAALRACRLVTVGMRLQERRVEGSSARQRSCAGRMNGVY